MRVIPQLKTPDGLTKIRTDIRKSFAKASSLLVNAGLFVSSPHDVPAAENLSCPELMRELGMMNTMVVFYGRGASSSAFVDGLAGVITETGHAVKDSETPTEDLMEKKPLILICCEMSDIDFFLPGVFSVAPRSAPLSVRMRSSYVSNFDGESVFREVGSLAVRSKRRG